MNDGNKQPMKAGTADQVLELDPGCVLHDPDNPPGRIEDVRDLEDSYRATGGQQVPGFVYRHPDFPGMYITPDGNRRLRTCRILGLKFKAILLERAPSKKELRRLRLTTNNVRKAMTPEQVAAEIGEHIAETGDTQEQAAAFFGLSAGYVSKLLAPAKSLCAELHPLRDNPAICRDVLRIIARMPTPELQRQLAERVLTTTNAGGTVSRETVEGWKEAMVSKPAKKSKAVKGKGKCLSFSFATDDHEVALAETLGLAEAIRKTQRHGLPLSSLPSLLKN
jgi:ParB/RepB/Spo0J family partition protein